MTLEITPTLAGFLGFIRNVMGITPADLPDDSPVIPMAFDVATSITSRLLSAASPGIYTLAVYNLGGSNIINYAPDQPGSTYFSDVRKIWNINAFSAGVVQTAWDVTTSVGFTVPKAMENLTFADLQYLKDPYGRKYLSFAQKVGPVWGLT